MTELSPIMCVPGETKLAEYENMAICKSHPWNEDFYCIYRGRYFFLLDKEDWEKLKILVKMVEETEKGATE